MPIFLAIYYLVPFKFKNFILLVFSLLFYSWGEPIYITLLIFSSIVDYFNGILTLLEDIQPSEQTTVPENIEITEEFVDNNLNRFKDLINFIIDNKGNLAIGEDVWNEMINLWDLSNPSDIAEFLDMNWDNIKDDIDLSQFVDILQEGNNEQSNCNEIKFNFM